MGLAATRDLLLPIVSGSTLSGGLDRLSFSGVEYDSREVRGGELFVALPGEKSHGHQFLRQAFDRGAALFLIEDEKAAQGFPEPQRVVLVKNSLEAFWKLANWWRNECKAAVIGVTGSVGKTTVKEMLASILLQSGRGAYSKKSFNNHVGVPYSIAKIERDHGWAVLEMGMNHRGEIAALARIAEPDVAIVSVIGPAHIENLGSLEAIADAKLEIVLGTKRALIVNAEDPMLVTKAELAAGARNLALKFFGRREKLGRAQVEASVAAVRSKGFDGIEFELTLRGETRPVKMSAVGRQNALNAGAAALGATTLVPSLSIEQVVSGLEAFKAPLMRLALKELSGGRIIVDDSYNANPQSVEGMLDFAEEVLASGKKVALILGDMRELGAHAAEYHRKIGERIALLKPAFLVTVGNDAAAFAELAEKAGIKAFRADSPELAAVISLRMDFDVLMVKGSRTVGLERAVATLLAREGKG